MEAFAGTEAHSIALAQSTPLPLVFFGGHRVTDTSFLNLLQADRYKKTGVKIEVYTIKKLKRVPSSFLRFYLQKYLIVEEWLLYGKEKPCKLARSTENYENYFDIEEVH